MAGFPGRRPHFGNDDFHRAPGVLEDPGKVHRPGATKVHANHDHCREVQCPRQLGRDRPGEFILLVPDHGTTDVVALRHLLFARLERGMLTATAPM